MGEIPGYPNLKPRITSEIAVELGRKGGLVRNDNKRFAQYLRRARKRGATNEIIQEMLGFIEDPKIGQAECFKRVNIVKQLAKENSSFAVMASKLEMEYYKMIHGERIKTENTNHNINVSINIIKPESEQ
jgi:predicted transcriptional regulator